MIIDVHCHYTLSREPKRAAPRFSFEPVGQSGGAGASPLPTDFDSCVSPRALGRLSWRLARYFTGLPREACELDAELRRRYAEHLFAPGPIDRFVLLAFDAVHDDEGRCRPLAQRRGDFGSDLYSSNSFIRSICAAYPRRFLFGASVHPYRVDALAALDDVAAAGACLVKWIPLHHYIDIADARSTEFLRRCAALGMPVLVHYGEEFSLTTHRPDFQAVGPMLEVLRKLRVEGAMPTVIVAHVATPVRPLAGRAEHEKLVAALTGEFADAPLLADISALSAWTKAGCLRRVLARRELHHKLLFGSDFPIPVLLQRVRGLLGRDYGRIAAIFSWPQRSLVAFRRMGFEDIVFQRAGELVRAAPK